MTLEQWNTSGEVYGTDTATGKKIWLSSKEMSKYWKFAQKDKNVSLTFLAPQNWRFEKDSKARYKNETYIQNADLTLLDELREKILKSGTTQFEIDITTNKYFKDLFTISNNVMNLKKAGCGLIS